MTQDITHIRYDLNGHSYSVSIESSELRGPHRVGDIVRIIHGEFSVVETYLEGRSQVVRLRSVPIKLPDPATYDMASEIIARLQELVAEHGDRPVVIGEYSVDCGDWRSVDVSEREVTAIAFDEGRFIINP